MGEIMRPLPFDKLMQWALSEYNTSRRIFGIPAEKFYRNRSGNRMNIFGTSLSSPVGPAAGPNSQLAENIIAAWLCGSRFIELKTVQKMDGEELRKCVPRPCINAEDEGYNVEWSTELEVPQAYGEYVKAWVAIHALSWELDIPGGRDLVFNMSVGYDLDGIRTEKIDSYIEGMKQARGRPVFDECIAWLKSNKHRFSKLSDNAIDAIPGEVSNSVTLSTLHGCPPKEIERIAGYLLEEKKVHTFVKCNPTLLGYSLARKLLDEMGYAYISFDDHHFKNDLQFSDAAAMLERLLSFAKDRSLSFGVKITNTFPVKITTGTLPGEEMYMSGRSLFPLSIHVAALLSDHFKGQLPISYSGGADYFNIKDIFSCGIRPITVATTILKPGGYERLFQLAETLEPLMKNYPEDIDAAALRRLADSVVSMDVYRKDHRTVVSRKTAKPLGLWDCFQAPCKDGGCPIEQQIPEYLRLVSEGKYDEALRVITIDNPVPGITGTICDHQCQGKCTRIDYDSSLEIRNAKRLAVEAAQKTYVDKLQPGKLATEKKVLVIGAGPAGISAAYYLRRAGIAVTVVEKRDKPFGIVEYIIPSFRIPETTIQLDYRMAVNMGVEFRFGVDGEKEFHQLRKQFDFVIIATGAWKEGSPVLKEGQEHILDALDFLGESKAKNLAVQLGKNVAVIGGGDVAMDCARAAMRTPGVERVNLLYRRTREFMPAEKEEINLALSEGVEIEELRAPTKYDDGCLCCEEMELGDWDASGRRGIVGTGKERTYRFDTVICAVGARVDQSLFETAGISLDSRGFPELNGANQTSAENIYAAGDCKAGPATVVKAAADAKVIARDICSKLGLDHGFIRINAPVSPETLYIRKGVLRESSREEADGSRCLACDQICEICVDVCPNRANVRISAGGFANPAQILHVDRLCNECGNCGTFCPHAGNPYKDKLTIYGTAEDFEDSENQGFLRESADTFRFRLEDEPAFTASLEDPKVPGNVKKIIRIINQDYPYLW